MTTTDPFNLAVQQHQAGDLAGAETLYRQALAHNPAHADALHGLGLLAFQAGRKDMALELIGRAIALRPAAAHYHLNLGSVLAALGRLDDAVAALDRALSLQPDFPQARYNLGNALCDQRRWAAAATEYRLALASRADHPDTHFNLAYVLFQQGEINTAIAAVRHAVSLRSDFPEAKHLLDLLLQKQRVPDEATGESDGVALNQLGISQTSEGKYGDAVATFARAAAARPDCAVTASNLGNALREAGRLAESIDCFQHLLSRRPDYPEAHWGLALALLQSGDYANGWREYEWRWQVPQLRLRLKLLTPRWRGEDLAGKTLVVHGEQGLGDNIQFARFIPEVTRRTPAKLILVCQEELLSLLGKMPGVAAAQNDLTPPPPHDLHAPLASLPEIFGTTIKTIPPAPYLTADATAVARWRERMPEDGSKRIGLVWRGLSIHPNDRLRSVDAARLDALRGTPGIWFCSLQKEVAAPPWMVDWSGEFSDFAHTAALVAALDLVISVDTAVAHLAGAMGKAVWLLVPYSPDWRWSSQRADSPWYPTMRLFRQPQPGEWDTVIKDVGSALRTFAKESIRAVDPTS